MKENLVITISRQYGAGGRELAGILAEKLGVKNLVLYHTEDKSIATRKQAYTAEAKEYYHGNVFVPDDLDVIEIG